MVTFGRSRCQDCAKQACYAKSNQKNTMFSVGRRMSSDDSFLINPVAIFLLTPLTPVGSGQSGLLVGGNVMQVSRSEVMRFVMICARTIKDYHRISEADSSIGKLR